MKVSTDEGGYCSFCLTWTSTLFEISPTESNAIVKLLRDQNKSEPRTFQSCNICRVSLKFTAKFIKMCHKSDQIFRAMDLKNSPPASQFQVEWNFDVAQGINCAMDWIEMVLDQQLPELEQGNLLGENEGKVLVKTELYEDEEHVYFGNECEVDIEVPKPQRRKSKQ